MTFSPVYHDLRRRDIMFYDGDNLFATSIIFIVLNTLFFVLRFLSRKLVHDARLGPDDYLMIPAYIFNMACCAMGIIMIEHVAIDYRGDVPFRKIPALLTRWRKAIWAFDWVYNLAKDCCKLSLIYVYLRIFPTKWIRVTCYILMALVVGSGLSFVIGNVFVCLPVPYFWDRSLYGGHCKNRTLFIQLSTIPVLLTDIPLFLLPLPQIVTLNMTLAKKVGLLLTFSTGLLGLISSCLRAVTLFRHSAFISDFSTNSVALMLWSIVEPGCYFIANCLLVLRPLVSKLMPDWFKSISSNAIESVSRGTRRTGTSNQTSGPRRATVATPTRPVPGRQYSSRNLREEDLMRADRLEKGDVLFGEESGVPGPQEKVLGMGDGEAMQTEARDYAKEL